MSYTYKIAPFIIHSLLIFSPILPSAVLIDRVHTLRSHTETTNNTSKTFPGNAWFPTKN